MYLNNRKNKAYFIIISLLIVIVVLYSSKILSAKIRNYYRITQNRATANIIARSLTEKENINNVKADPFIIIKAHSSVSAAISSHQHHNKIADSSDKIRLSDLLGTANLTISK